MVSINRFVQRPEHIVVEVFDSNQRNCIVLELADFQSLLRVGGCKSSSA